MKRGWLFVGLIVYIGATCLVIVALNREDAPDDNAANDRRPAEAVSYSRIFDLYSTSREDVDGAVRDIERGWHPGIAVMLVEAARFAPNRYAATATLELLERMTEQTFGRDINAWYHWLWARDYDPHPDYVRFKSELYSRLDERFSENFEKTDDALIRLDEVRWGGVRRDGIPPLKNPEMIPAEKATYLADTNVVFGVEINGDARCYPKRILAWHEMFKDTIGQMSVCGVY